MRRIITDTEDPVEAGRRFQEMVRAGIERFNEGSLPQAVSMLELAERLTSEKKVDSGTVELVRRRLGDTLDGEQLRKFTEKPDQHALLRRGPPVLHRVPSGGTARGAAARAEARPPAADPRDARGPRRRVAGRRLSGALAASRRAPSTKRSGSTGATSSTSCAGFRGAPRRPSKTRARSSCAMRSSAFPCSSSRSRSPRSPSTRTSAPSRA